MQGKQLKHGETEDKKPHFLYICQILDLICWLIAWSPLTHASHYMTTSRPAAATQMRARVSTALQPCARNVFYAGCNTPDFRA